MLRDLITHGSPEPEGRELKPSPVRLTSATISSIVVGNVPGPVCIGHVCNLKGSLD